MLLTQLLLGVIGLGFIDASPFPAELVVPTVLTERSPAAYEHLPRAITQITAFSFTTSGNGVGEAGCSFSIATSIGLEDSDVGIRCESSFNGDVIQSPSTPAIKYQLHCSTAAGPGGPSECLSIRHVCVVFPTVTGCATVKLGQFIKGTCPSKKRQSLPSGCATEVGQNLPQNLNA